MTKTASALFKSREKPCRLSPFILMTDPKVITDIFSVIEGLPENAGIIYRHFGKADRKQEAEKLRNITFRKNQQLLIGADPDLAIAVGADGVHFKRDAAIKLPQLWRKRCPDWIITMAGIKSGAYSGDLSVLDGLLISPVFQSQSPSAGAPIGVSNFSAQIQTLKCPVFALGGIHEQTAPELIGTGAYGLAGIRGFSQSRN